MESRDKSGNYDPKYQGLKFPDDQQRVYVLGRTGSGKTTGGLWHLTRSNFLRFPWVVIDTKRDTHIKKLEDAGAIEISVFDHPPETPGIYIVRPDHRNANDLNDFLFRVWEFERTGIFIDEGHQVHEMAPSALRSLLTQGRSKNIPMIVLSQRPAFIGRFTMSEADFYQIFRLVHFDDRKTVEKNTGFDLDEYTFEQHWSLWYQVEDEKTFEFQPCPPAEDSIKQIAKDLDTLRARPVML
jgi:hypothetical protein